MKLFYSLLSVSLITFAPLTTQAASSCKYSFNQEKTKVSWVAFKTPKKVGVKAGFDKVEIKTKKKNADTINKLVVGSTFMIDTTTVNSGNPERDEKLKNFFFTTKGTPVSIKGKVLSLKDNVLEVELQINKAKKKIKMTTTMVENKFTASSSIDVLDFALSENLGMIHEACKDLHEGKTWSDVEINIESEFDQKC